jgi:hypothetical protein
MFPTRAVSKFTYLGAAAAVSPGGKILKVKIVSFSPGLNGPATSFFTGGMLRRNDAEIATRRVG